MDLKLPLINCVLCFLMIFNVTNVSGTYLEDEFEEEEFFDSANMTENERSSRGFPFLAVVRLPNAICTSNGQQGSCRSRKSCEKDGGMIFGDSCANGYGVCCMLSLSCSASNNGQPTRVTSTGTHIVQPSMYSAPLQCQFIIPKKSGICQVRLDFNTFVMSQPDWNGNCNVDSMTVTGAANLPNFITCGTNTGQHLYLQYGSSESVTVNLNLNSAGKSYDILVTYVDCPGSSGASKKGRKGRNYSNKGSSNSQSNNNDNLNEIEPAPFGCAQYYTKPSDIVQSFNYQPGPLNAYTVQAQINNEQYMVCVKTIPGSNMITWRVCPDQNDVFSVSGGFVPANVQCSTDYVDIPGSQDGRYCGSTFPNSVTSTARPYMMYVNFDNTEDPQTTLPIDPSTGCCAGFCACWNMGVPVVPPAVCPVPTVPPFQCVAEQFLLDRTDFGNTGFCLQYTVS